MTSRPWIALLNQVTSGEVLSDAASIGLYATDASIYQIKPQAILLPKQASDVIAALKIAAEHKINVLPRGGGTSLAGQTVGDGLVIDFSKYMNQILEFNEEERWISVQPGVVRDVLNAYLLPHRLHFAPDPATSSRANVGGMIGNNSSGTKSILYGKTVDHVLALKVALADGTVIELKDFDPSDIESSSLGNMHYAKILRNFVSLVEQNREEIRARFPKVMRRVQGYNLDEFIEAKSWNLSKLICGSEGTLATILEAKLHLEPLPKHKAVCVVHFHTVNDAIRAVTPMLKFQPAAIEILDETVIQLSRANLTTKLHCNFIAGHPAAIQIVEFYGDDLEGILTQAGLMVQTLKAQNLGYAYPIFPEGKAYEDVWIIRKKGLGLMLGIKGHKKPLAFIEDASIPTNVLPEYIERVLAICRDHQTEAAMYAHASVGVIHVRPILDLRLKEDIERMKSIAKSVFDLVIEYGGSWSGEHGDGLVRSPFLKDYFGPTIYRLLREVKLLFDPDNRMNPGKIIEAEPMDSNLRYGEDYSDQPFNTQYQYKEDLSFQHAVHMCTGVGECRKTQGGTMCPSYRATMDEEHSTRGRANLLRLAMSGQLDGQFQNDRLYDALDLCLSCKACKSECPSNVDMAKLKGEVLQMRWDQGKATWRDRLVANSASMAKSFSGRLAPLWNQLLSNRFARTFSAKFTQLDARRQLPLYAKETFESWFRRHKQDNSLVPKVALFVDTYMNYHDTNIGKQIVKLLNLLGFRVQILSGYCCQRPRISNGFLRAAKKRGAVTLEQVLAITNQKIPILVSEPSCFSALTDDLPDLLEGQSNKLAANIISLDAFVAQRLDHPIWDSMEAKSSRIHIHGHCHQKALSGIDAATQVLERIPKTEVFSIPAGCCGMAGSFGYEREHYEVSENIANLALLPYLKELGTSDLVIADGFSCRHQIQHFSDHRAIHWAEAIKL